jgi:hypothetical protein
MKKPLFAFRKLPAFASEHIFGGHSFFIGGATSHTCKDGRTSNILLWIACCEKRDCDVMYYLETGMKGYFLSKRCPFHRRGTKAQKSKRILKILKDALGEGWGI